MTDIPNILQCEYCERNYEHGGECRMVQRGKHTGCLAFKEDTRGCLRRKEGILAIPLFYPIPVAGVWSNDEFEDVGALRIIRYQSIQWGKSTLRIGCEYEYYSPFETGEKKQRTKLIVLKGGAEVEN